MTVPHIKDLFANDVERPIEEVIKVDQTDEEIIKFEIDEYVVTDAIAGHYASILDVFNETPTSPGTASGCGCRASSAPVSRASPRCSASRSRTARSPVTPCR